MPIEILDLGLIDFKSAWDFQKRKFLSVKSQNSSSTLIFCRHYPVITLGRAANRNNILANQAELKKRRIEVYEIERGGDVTYHGPGQLMVYPIFDLNDFKKDIHWFLRFLEQIVIELLSDFGIKVERVSGLTGVWMGKQKIASLGIAIKNWVTFHGLSINVKEDDLRNFSLIRPCGMDIQMTSLETVLGRDVDLGCAKDRLIKNWRNYDECNLAGVRGEY